MSLSGKVETEIEIQAPSAKFYHIFRKQIHQIPNISTDNVHSSEVHEGDWETVGSVKHWEYTLEDKKTSAKERIEAIDDENKTISYSLFDGEVDKCYKSLKVTLQVKDKENGGGGLVKWTIEYEKLEENIKGAAPETYLDFAAKVTKDIDAHLLKA